MVSGTISPRLMSMTDLTPLEEARLRVMAAGIDLTEQERHLQMLKHFMRGHMLHPDELEALLTLVGEIESLIEMKRTFVDTTGAFREGYDEVPEESAVVDLHLDDVDFGDQDNWDEDILAVADDVIKGAAFERKTPDAPQAIHAPNKPGLLNRQPKSQPIDLGLDELEMELDLEGGSLDGTLSQQLQQLEQTEPEDDQQQGLTKPNEWTPPLELPGRAFEQTYEYPQVENEPLQNMMTTSRPQEVDERQFRDDPFAALVSLSDTNVEPPSDEPNDTELDLEKVEQLLKIGALSKARNISEALQTIRLVWWKHSILPPSKHFRQHLRAAELLWERAYNVESNHPNVQFNYARLLHKVGRIKKLSRF